MKVLLNLNRSDDVAPQMQFISLRAASENNREDHSGFIEIVVNEYCEAIYLNLHSLFNSSFGFEFCNQETFNRRPKLMIEEDKELDVSMLSYSYEKFEEPPEGDPDYDEDENYPDEEEEDR